MAKNLRSELRKAITDEIAELTHKVAALSPSVRDVTRLRVLHDVQTIVEHEPAAFPKIERIAIDLWQASNGDHVSPMDLGPDTRKVMLTSAALAYLIVHRASI